MGKKLKKQGRRKRNDKKPETEGAMKKGKIKISEISMAFKGNYLSR